MIRKLAPYTRGYRIWIVLGVLCSAGEAVLELLLPKLMSNIVDVGIAGGDRAYILATGTKMVLMALCSLALGIGAAALSSRAGMGFGANLRLAEYTQVQKFSFSNIEHFSTASLITRLTNDVSSVQMMLMMGMRLLVRAPVMLITAVIMSLRISLRLSQVFLVIVPLLIVAVALVIKFVGPIFNSLQRATDDLNLVVQEDLSAIRVVKSFVREDREREKFAARSDNLRATAERAYGFVVMFFQRRLRRDDALRRPAGLLHLRLGNPDVADDGVDAHDDPDPLHRLRPPYRRGARRAAPDHGRAGRQRPDRGRRLHPL